MPELAEILDRTTPDDIAPVDVTGIAHTARRRTMRRRAGSLAAWAGVIAVLAGGLAGLRDSGTGPRERVVSARPDRRDGPVLRDGMGRWRQLPDAPIPAVTGSAALADGRILAWGDPRLQFAHEPGAAEPTFTVAVLDPASGVWGPAWGRRSIEDLHEAQVLFAGGRLLYLGVDDQGAFRGAVFDADLERWTDVPELADFRLVVDDVGWDGTSLVLVRTSVGEVVDQDWDGGPIESEPSPEAVRIDARVDEPLTRIWTFGASHWKRGATPPLRARKLAGSAMVGGKLVVIGGRVDPTPPADGGRWNLSDGAIYDVREDRWRRLPALPWRATNPSVGRVDGRLVVAGGVYSLDQIGSNAMSHRVVGLSRDGRRWERMTPSPADMPRIAPAGRRPAITTRPLLVTGLADPGAVLLDGVWEHTPGRQLTWWGDVLLATTDIGGSGNLPYSVRLRRGRGDWVSAAQAPFSTSWGSAPPVVVGAEVFVIGATSPTDLRTDRSAWVLDLSD